MGDELETRDHVPTKSSEAAGSITVQRELVVGHADDPLEREADRIADQVTAAIGAAGPPHHWTGRGEDGRIVRSANGLRADNSDGARDDHGGRIHRSTHRTTAASNATARMVPPASALTRIRRQSDIGAAGGALDTSTEREIQGARSAGTPLDGTLRRQMESAFGADFGNVRMHVNARSDELNDRIQARAFTTGSDVFVRRQDYAPARATGRHLIAHELAHTLQQGSSKISRTIRRDGASGQQAPDDDNSQAEAEEAAEASAAASSDGVAIKLSIGTVAPESEREPIGQGVGREDSTSATHHRPTKQRSRRGSSGTQFEWVPRINLTTTTTDAGRAAAGGAADKVNTSNMAVSSTTVGGDNVDAFGAMTPSYSLSGITATWKEGTILVQGSLNGRYAWGVDSGGNTDVASGTDPVVTKDNYEAIVQDLDPLLVEKSWRAPRDTYWSKAICERHEKYHAQDETEWAKGKAKGVIAGYFKKNPVTLTESEQGDTTKVLAKTKAALDEALAAVDTASFQFYTGGQGSYYSYDGEEKAFGDGKEPYKELATAVKKQGEELAKAGTGGT